MIIIKKGLKIFLLFFAITNLFLIIYVQRKEINLKYTAKLDLEQYKNNYNQLPNGPIGILKINKIGLEQIFYDKYHPKNNIQEHVTIMKESDMPNITNGNFIIGAHSGTGYLAFFNQLYQLQKNDIIEITYNQKEYIYKVDYKYLDDKNGKIKIYRDQNRTTLTLFTCNNNDKKNYLIVIAYQIKS